MSGNKDDTNISFDRLVNKIEEMGIQYFRDCILKTNQYSTRYILQKVLQDHSAHVERIKSDISAYENLVISEKQVKLLFNRSAFDTFVDKYDVENLNFVEATELAIKLTEHFMDLYNKLASLPGEPEIQKASQFILSKKSIYLEILKKEYDRLSYKDRE